MFFVSHPLQVNKDVYINVKKNLYNIGIGDGVVEAISNIYLTSKLVKCHVWFTSLLYLYTTWSPVHKQQSFPQQQK